MHAAAKREPCACSSAPSCLSQWPVQIKLAPVNAPYFNGARLLIAGFVENGWDSSPGDVLEIDDLPAHIYTEAGERVLQPCAEVLLGERALNAILARHTGKPIEEIFLRKARSKTSFIGSNG